MTTYVQVRLADNAVGEEREFNDAPPDTSRKGFVWLPLAVTDPAFDPATQVRSGPVDTVGKDSVSRVWTVRDMTSDELDAVKGATVDALDILQLKIAFNHENRIRALEGKPAASAAQFKTALKALL
jgi:hypothetical protein